jgi:hypothetical protein
VVVVNRNTDSHKDNKDCKKGLTALVHLEKFTGRVLFAGFMNTIRLTSLGGAFGIKELSIVLEEYQSGALLLFRGAERTVT